MLYLDLKKAGPGGQQGGGVDTPKEDQTKAEYDSSFARRPEGVAAGEALDPDDPDVGKDWDHSEEDSNVSESKAAAKQRTKEAKEEGLVKSISILKNLNSRLEENARARVPNASEREFLVTILGYSNDEISKGAAVITGRNRSLFNKWLCDRLLGSAETLKKSVGD